MAGQGTSDNKDAAGFTDIATALAPLALLLAGRGNTQAGQMLAVLASMSKGREDRERGREDRERDEAGAAAMAERMAALGFASDPRMTPANNAALANVQIAKDAAERQVAKDVLTQKDTARSRDVFGTIAGIRSKVGTDLPEDLIARLQTLAPEAGRSTEVNTGYGQTLADIRDSEKRLEHALNAGRRSSTVPGPEGYDPQEQLVSDLPAFPGGAFRVGTTGKVAVPAMDFAEVPSNMFALQRHVARTGDVPDEKTAERLGQMFNVPLKDLPGGLGAHRAAVKPPFPPFTAFPANPKGAVTSITAYIDPDTGKPESVQGKTYEGVAKPEKPEKPERPQAFERLESLAMVAAGRPELALPEHRKLTAAQAQSVRNVIGRAEQQVSLDLSAALVRDQILGLDEQIRRLNSIATGSGTPREKVDAAGRVDALRIKRQPLQDYLDEFMVPGPITPSRGGGAAAPPAGDPTYDEYKQQGLLR